MPTAPPHRPSFPALLNLATENVPATHRCVEVTSSADPELPYRIILPAGWRRDPRGDKPGAPGEVVGIGHFVDSLRPDSAIVQISASQVPIEVSTLEWINIQAKTLGIRLSSGKLITDGPGHSADVVGWFGPDDNVQVARILCRADRGFMFIVLGMAPVARYDALKDDLALALGSFALLRSAAPGQLEPWEHISVTAPDFRVAYPASWAARTLPAAATGASGIEILLPETESGRMLAFVRVKGVDPNLAAARPDILLKTSAEELTRGPIVIDSPWEVDRDPVLIATPGILAAVRASGRMNGAAAELRSAVLNGGSLQFCVTSISVPESTDAILWMRGNRAYSIALRTAAAGAAPPT